MALDPILAGSSLASGVREESADPILAGSSSAPVPMSGAVEGAINPNLASVGLSPIRLSDANVVPVDNRPGVIGDVVDFGDVVGNAAQGAVGQGLVGMGLTARTSQESRLAGMERALASPEVQSALAKGEEIYSRDAGTIIAPLDSGSPYANKFWAEYRSLKQKQADSDNFKQKNFLETAGQSQIDASEQGLSNVSPDFKDSTAYSVAEVTGQLIPYLAGPLAAPLGIGQAEKQSYDDYMQTLASRGEKPTLDGQMRALGLGALTGIPDALPVLSALHRFSALAKVLPEGSKKRFAKLAETRLAKLISKVKGKPAEVARTALENGVTEIGQQLAQNYIAKTGYDENRDITQGAMEAGAVGAGAGGAIATALALIMPGRPNVAGDKRFADLTDWYIANREKESAGGVPPEQQDSGKTLLGDLRAPENPQEEGLKTGRAPEGRQPEGAATDDTVINNSAPYEPDPSEQLDAVFGMYADDTTQETSAPAEGVSRIASMDEAAQEQEAQRLRQMNEGQGLKLSEEQINAIAKQRKARQEMGWHLAKDNEKLDVVNRAIDYAKGGGNSHYVSIDFSNLGGMNAHFNDVASKTDAHFKAMMDMLKEEVIRVDPNATFLRSGGDEFAIVTQSGTEQEIQSAISAARGRIKQYAADNGFGDIAHAKSGKANFGVDLYDGISEVKSTSSARDVIDNADSKMGLMKQDKKRGDQNVGRELTEATGRDSSTARIGRREDGILPSEGSGIGQKDASQPAGTADGRAAQARGLDTGAGRGLQGNVGLAGQDRPDKEELGGAGSAGASAAIEADNETPRSLQRPESEAQGKSSIAPVDLPVSDIINDPDIPQFKQGADKNGVVEPLQGRYDPRDSGQIQVIRRKDGRLSIISGRHRLQKARDSGEESISAQVYREVDEPTDNISELTVAEARRLDAELNIRDGNGSVSDFIQFFRSDKKYGKIGGVELAAADGLLRNHKAKVAADIASKGTDDLIGAYRNGVITDEGARSISNAAPGSEKLQAVGIKAIQNGKTISDAVNTMKAVATLSQGSESDQGDMFGLDDTAMKQAEEMARIASRKQRDIRERIAAVRGAAKRPDKAKALGVDVRDPEGLNKRIAELSQEAASWDSWETNPDLVRQIREEIEPDVGLRYPNQEPQEQEVESQSSETSLAPDPADMFSLSAQTESDAEAEALRLRKAEDARKKQEKDAEDRRKADSEALDFRLSGSDRPDDVSTAGGQAGMFNAKGEVSVEARNNSKGKEPADNREEFEHNGVRIYPGKVERDGVVSDKWFVETHENKEKREKGERTIGGDAIASTKESAIRLADQQNIEEERRIAFENELKDKEVARETAERERREDNVNGFVDGMSPLQAGRAKTALDKRYQFQDGAMSIREKIEKLSAVGALELDTYEEPRVKPMSRRRFNNATQREQDAHARKMKAAGNKTVYLVNGLDLGKTGYDYAAFLSQNSERDSANDGDGVASVSNESDQATVMAVGSEEANSDNGTPQDSTANDEGLESDGMFADNRAVRSAIDWVRLATSGGEQTVQGRVSLPDGGETTAVTITRFDKGSWSVHGAEGALESFVSMSEAKKWAIDNVIIPKMKEDGYLSKDKRNDKPSGRVDQESDQAPKTPDNLPAHEQVAAINKRLLSGESVPLHEIKTAFESVVSDPEKTEAELNKLNKAKLQGIAGGYHRSGDKKADLIRRAYRSLVGDFRFIGNKDGVISTPGGADIVSLAREHLDVLTQDTVSDYANRIKAEIDSRLAQRKAIKERLDNPQTLDDFKEAIGARGIGALTVEQRAAYDRLVAELSVSAVNQDNAGHGVVEGFESDGSVQVGSVEEGKNTKTGETVYNVKVIDRLGKDKFKEALRFARTIRGGYWKGNFYFPTNDAAEQFRSWMAGNDVDLSANKAEAAEQKKARVKERLQAMADRMKADADSIMNADRKVNTAKRAREADSAISSAKTKAVNAAILQAVADGKAPLLVNLKERVQVELLDRIANSLKYSADRSLVQSDENSNRTFKEGVTPEQMVASAKYPLNPMSDVTARRIADDMSKVGGFKMAAKSIESALQRAGDGNGIRVAPKTMQKIYEYVQSHGDKLAFYSDAVANRKRLERMGINNPPALRAALVEFIKLKQSMDVPEADASLKKLERELQQTVLGNRNAFNDFFPTPSETAADVVDVADIQSGMKVLEPSAGNGMLADAIAEQGADVDVVEQAAQLRAILQEKGYNLVGDDFMEMQPSPEYDRIVMNPPFSKNQDVAHVMHAYQFLKPGGRLVAIVGASAGNKQGGANKAFRELLDSTGAEEQALPEGSFKSSLNPTGVNTKLVVIDKPVDESAAVLPDQFADVSKMIGQAAEIEDFGEKLGGARKDMATTLRAEISDEDLSSMPLSKIWPASSIDAIEDTFSAAFATAARAEIPAKPKLKSRVDAWVKKVRYMREFTADVMEGSIPSEELSPLMKDFMNKVTLLTKLDRTNWGRIGEVRVRKNAYRLDAEGNRIESPSVSVEVDGRWKRYEGNISIDDVAENLSDVLAVAAESGRMKFEIRRRSANHFFINKSGDKEYTPIKSFDSAEAARDFKNNHYDELVAEWELVKQRKNVNKADVRNQENRVRDGMDYRKGEDVTPEKFASTFGFRGTEFGNWVSQGHGDQDRQGLLNQAYDALMDLANVVGIPPKAISLNGTLGLAFGARGRGTASAHFESSSLVINLTKTKGAGSLAHEWFHALDNYFSSLRPKTTKARNNEDARRDAFITYQPENYYVLKSDSRYRVPEADFEAMIRGEEVAGARYNDSTRKPELWEKVGGVRPEVSEAFSKLVNALNESPMTARSRSIDKSADAYWSQIIERAARSFENYVIGKLGERGIVNDFLANVKSVEDFARDADRYPYLRPEELKPVSDAFDNLFATIETKEGDDGNIILYKRNGTRVDGGMSTKSVQEVVDSITGGNSDNIEVVRSFSDLPSNVLAVVRADGVADGDIRGLYWKGKSYLLADQMRDIADVEETVYHEHYTHGGLRVLYGKQLHPFLTKLFRENGGLFGVRNKAKKQGIDLREYEKALSAKPDISTDQKMSVLMEELMAHMSKTTGTLRRMLEEWIGAIRQFFREHGFPNMARNRVSDLALIMKRAREAAIKAGQRKSVQEEHAPYTEDMFGNPVDVVKPATKTHAKDVAKKSKLADTTPPDGDYIARTIVGVETTREVATSKVTSPAELATATEYLYNSAVERVDVVVTDAAGNILGIVGGFKGKVDQASAFPSVIIGEAVRIPGASKLWISHNHPSGESTLSGADRSITDALYEATKGTGIEVQGIIAVADGKYSSYMPKYTSTAPEVSVPIPAATGRTKRVPVIERVRTGKSEATISSPSSAMAIGRSLREKSGRDGIMLLDNRHGLLAYVYISDSMRGLLRGTGGADAIYRAISEANAAAAILVSDGSLNDRIWDGVTVGQNIAAALEHMEIRVLDSINIRERTSTAAQGGRLSSGLMYQFVYHGTRSRGIEGDGFKLDEIGTGEGAQAYGWGIYFAGRRDIADYYREKLSGDSIESFTLEEYEIAGARQWIARDDNGNSSGYLDDAELVKLVGDNIAREAIERSDAEPGSGDGTYDLDEPLQGQTYRANIPENDILLDWDKPLSEQSQKVREAMDAIGRSLPEYAHEELVENANADWDDLTGREQYQYLSRLASEGELPDQASLTADSGDPQRAASEFLNAHGIPGLRYLDGNSRSKGEGHHNYVIWNERLLTPEAANITPLYSRIDRSDVQSAAKSLGLPATGTTESITKLVKIAGKNPQEWTRDEFDTILPHLSVHQDMRDAGNRDAILNAGLTRGMYDLAAPLEPRSRGDIGLRVRTFATQYNGKDVYVFISGMINERNGRFTEEATPVLFVARPDNGGSLWDAIHADGFKWNPRAVGDTAGESIARKDVFSVADSLAQWAEENGFTVSHPSDVKDGRVNKSETSAGNSAYMHIGITGHGGLSVRVSDHSVGVGRLSESVNITKYSDVSSIKDRLLAEKEAFEADPINRMQQERVSALIAAYGGKQDSPTEADIKEAARQYAKVVRDHQAELRAHDEDGAPLPAPNGKPSNLNREQWILVRTPNFKRWFGDWEGRVILLKNKRPQGSKVSKVVDDNGEPLVVYHGTDQEFTEFKVGESYRNNEEPSSAFYFTPTKWAAADFSDNREPMGVFLMAQKVLDLRDEADIRALNDAIDNEEVESLIHGLRPSRFNANENIWDQILEQEPDAPNDLMNGITGWAEDNGFNGVIFEDANRGDTFDSYVVFDPNQIKSATGNAGTYGDGGNIMYMRRDGSEDSGPIVPDETFPRKAQRKLQDRYNRFTVIQDWLKGRGVKLSESADVYRALERYSGRMSARLGDFREKELRQLVRDSASTGFSLEEIAEYLHAEHAEERNRKIAGINKNMPDGGSGMSNADAREILARHKSDYKLHEIAKKWRAITDGTKHILLDAGILSKEQVAAFDSTYQYYVPLKGAKDSRLTTATGKGMTAKANIKRALGHGEREEAIIENIISDRERAIVLAEKNLVTRHLLQLAIEARNPDLITVEKPEKRAVLRNGVAYAVWYKGAIIDTFQTEQQAADFIARARSFIVGAKFFDFAIQRTREPSVVYMARPQLADNETQVYIEGYRVRIQINDELLARAYNNIGNDGVVGILELSRNLNTWLSKAYTGLNLEFLVVNVVRDFLAGAPNLLGHEGVRMVSKAVAMYPKAMVQLLKYHFTGVESRLVYDYRHDGGQTGAGWLSDIERIGDNAQAAYHDAMRLSEVATTKGSIAAFKSAMRRLVHFLTAYIEALNAAGENAFRLATYSAAIDSGKTRAEAASLAKNVTVNFNRRGEWGASLNAAYLFFNASVQGTASIAGSVFKGVHKKQLWSLMAAVPFAGFIYGLTQGGADDDDWDSQTEYTKQRYFLIRTSNGFAKIPIPYGYGWLFTTGRYMADMMSGKTDVQKTSLLIAANFMTEFSPFGQILNEGELDSRNAVMSALPTIAAIPVGGAFNYNSFGGPIRPESPYDTGLPDSQKMFRGTKGTIYEHITTELNKLTLGDPVSGGGIDISPETLEYLWSTFTGGAGRFYADALNLGLLTAQGVAFEDVGSRNTPLLRRFYQEDDIQGTRNLYYGKLKEAKDALDSYQRAVKFDKVHGTDLSKKYAQGNEILIWMAKHNGNIHSLIKTQRDLQQQVMLSDKKIAVKLAEVRRYQRVEEELERNYIRIMNGASKKQD